MVEIVVNLHMHTTYSDGHGSYSEIARAAMRAGVDVVIVTDHNIWLEGPEKYHTEGGKQVLLLVGEEVHDQSRDPQKNHLLVFGANREVAQFAKEPQELIDAVREAGGISFLAHPYDEDNRMLDEADIAWEAWEVEGFTGVELWNGLSELKSLMRSKLHAIWYAYNPDRVPHGPPVQMLAKWDDLMRSGKKVVAVGGSDAHKIPGRLGPLRRDIFPYETHFRSVNTHVFLEDPLTGSEEEDAPRVIGAMRNGHCFVGNDMAGSTKGFRFHGQCGQGDFQMGDEVGLGTGVTLQIKLPARNAFSLLKDGKPFKSWEDREQVVVHVDQPGVYRVEAYRQFLGKERGWIFSNPVYVRG